MVKNKTKKKKEGVGVGGGEKVQDGGGGGGQRGAMGMMEGERAGRVARRLWRVSEPPREGIGCQPETSGCITLR